jgi:tetratricopeptide (TPR) repeat protein
MWQRIRQHRPPGGQSDRREWSLNLALFLLALLIRGIYLLELEGSALFSVLLGDGRQYYAWAADIAAGEWVGREAFYQAPLYPYFMAALMKLFGLQPWPVRVTQMLLGATSCVLIAVAGRRFFSYRVGLVAGLLLALYPPAIFFDGLVQKTSLSLFFASALLALLGELMYHVRRPWLLLSGVTLGCLALTRENALLLVPLIVVWILIYFGDSPFAQRSKWVAWFALGLALTLAPVAIRNLAVSGHFFLTTSQLGSNFFIGNNAEADGRYRPLRAGREDARVERQDARELAEAELGRRLNAGEVSRYWLSRSFSYISSQPGHWGHLLLRKVSLLMNAREIVDTESLEVYREHSRLLTSLGWLLHFGILGPLAFLGFWVTRDQWRRLWILYAIGLTVAFSLVLFYIMARYRMPIVPLVALFAAAGLDQIIRNLKDRAAAPLLANLAIVAVCGTVQNWPLPIETLPRATTYYNLGVSLFEQGDPAQAQIFLEKTLRIRPDFADGHYSLANVLAESGEASIAMDHYRQALTLDPRHAEAHFQLAHLLAAKGKLDAAIRHYRVFVELEPGHVATHVNLGYLLIQNGQPDEAADHFRTAISLSPEHAMAHNLLANVLAHQGRSAEAIQEYEAALAIDSELADAHFKLGVLLAEQGKLDLARSHLEKTILLLPDFSEARLQLAAVLERQRISDD